MSKDRARIDDFDLECAKECAKDFVCNRAADIVGRYNLDSEGSIGEDDLFCAYTEFGELIRINEKIEKCRSEKALRKVLNRHYDKNDVKEVMGD